MMLLAKLMGWLTGGGLANIASELRQAHRDKLAAQTDEAKLDAEVTIQQLQARQSVLVAEQANWMTRWIRPALALPVAIFLWKVLVWDIVLGWGVTPDPSDRIWQIIMIVIGAYFLTRPFEKAFRRRG